MIGNFSFELDEIMDISSKISQIITNNVYQINPHFMIYPTVYKQVVEMMYLITIIQL